jgi:hypothetical protein
MKRKMLNFQEKEKKEKMVKKAKLAGKINSVICIFKHGNYIRILKCK